MTTAIRISAGPARLLPPVVPALLLLLAVLLAPVAPAKAGKGPYRVDTPEFSVVDGFECRERDTACSAVVAGRVLTVEAELFGPCRATYDGRPVRCENRTEYGPAGPWVRLGSLGVPPDQVAPVPLWRDAVDRWGPWWLGGSLVLALLMGIATAVFYRGPRLPDERHVLRSALTGLAAWLVPVAGTLLVTPAENAGFAGVVVVAPHLVLFPAALVTWWQYLAAGPQSGRLRARLGQAALAAVATALYAGGGALCLAMAAGLPD